MEPTEREHGTRALAMALQRNTNIETLKLSSLQAFYYTAILQSLRSNSSVKMLIFSATNVAVEEWDETLHQLLGSTTSIQRFEFEQAEKAGPDALFRGLRSVLQSDYGSLPGGRKRKRPQYYAR